MTPRGRYAVQCIEDRGAGLAISSGKAVVLIGFAMSENGPHMAPDNRYYLRAGAHTEPASHFFVEAIHARRAFRSPMLRHVVRRKPEEGGVLQIGIICLNDAPALNVEIDLDPLPQMLRGWESYLPLVVPVISRQSPFYFDFHLMLIGQNANSPCELKLKYADLADHIHHVTLEVDVIKQMGPNLGSGNAFKDLEHAIERSIEKVAYAIQSKR